MNVMQVQFLERLHRFAARVRLPDGTEQIVHVASSGRMTELLLPGAAAVIKLAPMEPAHKAGKSARKTSGLLCMVRAGENWVSVDTSLPGRVVRQALAQGALPPFRGYAEIRPEFRYGESRIDFRLAAGDQQAPCLLEVKSVTSAVPDSRGELVARFPDAPTARGTKHLRELERALEEGYRCAVLFVVQRSDARRFGPWDAIDPGFGAALRAAAGSGVEVYAWNLQVEPDRVILGTRLPVDL